MKTVEVLDKILATIIPRTSQDLTKISMEGQPGKSTGENGESSRPLKAKQRTGVSIRQGTDSIFHPN